MTEDIPAALVRYLATRDQQRATAVQAFLDALTPRERWLVHEAAVMGWVLGARSVPDGWQQEVPKDEEIVASVVAHCQSTSDLYSVIGEDIRALIRKIVQQNESPTVDAVARVVADLSRRDEGQVVTAIRKMVEDESLVENDAGLRVGEPG